MSKIKHIKVMIMFKQGIIKQESEYINEHIEVIAENENFIVLNDDYFTKVAKVKSWIGFYAGLDKIKISSQVDDRCFGTSVTYYYYGTKDKRASSIKKKIKEYITEKFGCMVNADLSFMDEPTKGRR